MTEPTRIGSTSQQPIEQINVPDQGRITEKFEDAGSLPAELGKAKSSPFQAIKRFFSSIIQGIIYLGEKIGNVFSSAKKGEDHASRLGEIKNNKGSISAESINNGTVKVQNSEEKEFNLKLKEAQTLGKYKELPQGFFDVIKSTDEKYQKINTFYQPIQESGSRTERQVTYGVNDAIDASEGKFSLKEYKEIVNRRAVSGMLILDPKLKQDIITFSGNMLKSGEVTGFMSKIFLQLEKNAKQGDAEAIKFMSACDNVNTKEDYDKLVTALKEFIKPQVELRGKTIKVRKDLLEELNTKIKANFPLNVNVSAIEAKINFKMDAITSEEQMNEQKQALSELIDKFIKDRKDLLEEIDTITTDEKLKQDRYESVLRDREPLKKGEMTQLQQIAEEINNDKTVLDTLKLATSKNIPDSKKVYDTIMALTTKIIKNIEKLKLSLDGTDGFVSNTAFVLQSLTQNRPELKGLSKFVGTITTESGKYDSNKVNASMSDAPTKRQGCLAFTIAFGNVE